MLGRDLVTSPAIYCFDDQGVDEAAKLMHDNQIRRLVVLSRDKQMVGVISLGDLAMTTDDKLSGDVLQSVSEPMSASRPEPG
jgi:predicted transcriptional regulator